MNCLFCRIANGELPAKVFLRNDAAVAFLDINPRALGHSMVIPVKHTDSILDLPEMGVADVFGLVKRTTAILEKVFVPDGFTIGINHGRAAGQAVDHLHIHIIPRWRNDGGTSIHGVVSNAPDKSIEDVFGLITAYVKESKEN